MISPRNISRDENDHTLWRCQRTGWERRVCQNVFDASYMSESAAEGLGYHTVSTACCQSQKGFPWCHVCLLLITQRRIKYMTSENTDHFQYFWQEWRRLKQQRSNKVAQRENKDKTEPWLRCDDNYIMIRNP